MFGALWKGWKKFFSEFQKIYLEMLAVTADPLSVKNTTHQCDQIGLFLKYPCDNISYKSSPNKWWRFKMGLLNVNTAVATFWGTVWKNWATFYFSIWSHCCNPSPSSFSSNISIYFDRQEFSKTFRLEFRKKCWARTSFTVQHHPIAVKPISYKVV